MITNAKPLSFRDSSHLSPRQFIFLADCLSHLFQRRLPLPLAHALPAWLRSGGEGKGGHSELPQSKKPNQASVVESAAIAENGETSFLGKLRGDQLAIQKCIQPSPQAAELSLHAQLTGEGFAGQGDEGRAFPNPDKVEGLALQRRLDRLSFQGSISVPCIFWPHQTSQTSCPCSLPLLPLIHLLPVWLKIFASMAEHSHASVSPPVKRTLTDGPASLEALADDRHLGMLWGPGQHCGGSATPVLSTHFLPRRLSALQTSLSPVPGMKGRSLGLIQIRAAQLQR